MGKAGRSCLITHNVDFCTEECRKPLKSQSVAQRASNGRQDWYSASLALWFTKVTSHSTKTKVLGNKGFVGRLKCL